MKKRILAFLLSAALAFGLSAEGVCAQPADLGEDVSDGAAVTGEEGAVLSGLRQPVFLELAPDDVPEVYEESTDGGAMQKRSAAYSTNWDSYSTNYYYNLLNDSQRELWDKLDRMCYGYLTGTETLTDRDDYRDLSQGLDFGFYYTKSVVYTNMSRTEARDVEFMFIVSNPQYYFLQTMLMGTSHMGSGGYAYLTINESFANGAARKAATQRVQSAIDSWIPLINAEPTYLLKEKKIHDLICEKVDYDPYFNEVSQNPYNQTVYSVLVDPRKTTVCAGYSQAMQLLCNAVGIDCAVVTSYNHEWNIVRLNGTWYCVDATWNDLSEEDAAYFGQGVMYEYFNRSAQIFQSGASSAVESHTPETRWTGYLPQLIFDSGASAEDIGTIYTPVETLGAPRISCSGSKAVITAPSAGTTVYYTTDGTDPSIAFTRARRYTGPFSLFGTTTVKAVAVRNGYFDSQIVGQTIIPKYNVVFHANGGYMNSKSTSSISKTGIDYRTVIGTPGAPKRKGYAFLGWYTGKSGGSRLGNALSVTADAVYYARWAKINTKKKATVASVKNGSGKSMKVKVKAVSIATGYQIRYSLNKNMKSARKKETAENTCTIKNLKKGKTYYVQARIYQKESVSGKKKYGKWSKAKTVKIRK